RKASRLYFERGRNHHGDSSGVGGEIQSAGKCEDGAGRKNDDARRENSQTLSYYCRPDNSAGGSRTTTSWSSGRARHLACPGGGAGIEMLLFRSGWSGFSELRGLNRKVRLHLA